MAAPRWSPRLRWWLLALVPALAGGGVAAAAGAGVLADPRLQVTVSALRRDWALLLGLLATAALAGLLAVAARRDLRGRRRLTASAAAAAEERRRLMARLDHELKNPLTAIRAAVANARAAGPGPDQDAGLRTIEEQALRLARLTADLRKIAGIGTAPVAHQAVDVTELLEDAVDALREQPGAGERAVSLDLPRAPWPLPPVRGDGDLLSLAVGNLLDNALKYTPPGGRIEVRARETQGMVVIEVADTGQGIPPEDLPQVWAELYRSPAARGVPGSGLGLPLVRAVADQHGGTVVAESRAGSGTVVRLQLPGDGSAGRVPDGGHGQPAT